MVKEKSSGMAIQSAKTKGQVTREDKFDKQPERMIESTWNVHAVELKINTNTQYGNTRKSEYTITKDNVSHIVLQGCGRKYSDDDGNKKKCQKKLKVVNEIRQPMV